jgi:hypothetical protein
MCSPALPNICFLGILNLLNRSKGCSVHIITSPLPIEDFEALATMMNRYMNFMLFHFKNSIITLVTLELHKHLGLKKLR